MTRAESEILLVVGWSCLFIILLDCVAEFIIQHLKKWMAVKVI